MKRCEKPRTPSPEKTRRLRHRQLRDFVDRNCGDGSDYSTASEFLRDVLREKKHSQEDASHRNGIPKCYSDLVGSRFVEFSGSIWDAVNEVKRRDQEGW